MKPIQASFAVVLALLIHALNIPSIAAQSPPIENCVLPTTAAALVMHPKKMLELEMLELFPHEVLKAYGQEQLGADFTQATEAILVVEAPQSPQDRQIQFGVMVRFDQPQTFKGAYEGGSEKVDVSGQTYFYFGPKSQRMALTFRDNKTMLFGSLEFLPKMTDRAAQDGPVKDVIKKYPADGTLQLYVAVEPLRTLINENLPPQEQVPPPFQGWLEAPDLTDYVYTEIDLSDNFRIASRVGAVDEDAAKKLRRLHAQSTQMAKAGAMMELAKNIGQLSPAMQNAINTYADRVLQYAETASKPVVDGNELVFTASPDSGSFQVATIGILTGMLLPAVQQVRFASRRVQSLNNLRILTIAALNYESAFMRFPQQAIYSEDGTPLLSWRVTILPFIEQQNLYQQFHLDEPWDSPHNIELLDQIPKVLQSPLAGDLGGKTVYQCFVGPGTMFPNDPKRKIGYGSITDGTSNTLLFVESNADQAIEWTKPGDIAFDPEKDITAIGKATPEGFPASYADGSTRVFSRDTDKQVIKDLIMRADGNLIPQLDR